GTYVARIMKRLEAAPRTVLGVFGKAEDAFRIHPTDRRYKTDFSVHPTDTGGAEPGEIVVAEALPGRAYGLPQARVTERLGSHGDPRSATLIALHTHGIPTDFTPEALRQAERTKPVPLGQRTD